MIPQVSEYLDLEVHDLGQGDRPSKKVVQYVDVIKFAEIGGIEILLYMLSPAVVHRGLRSSAECHTNSSAGVHSFLNPIFISTLVHYSSI